jgi:hypothetical protein
MAHKETRLGVGPARNSPEPVAQRWPTQRKTTDSRENLKFRTMSCKNQAKTHQGGLAPLPTGPCWVLELEFHRSLLNFRFSLRQREKLDKRRKLWFQQCGVRCGPRLVRWAAEVVVQRHSRRKRVGEGWNGRVGERNGDEGLGRRRRGRGQVHGAPQGSSTMATGWARHRCEFGAAGVALWQNHLKNEGASSRI